MSAYLRYAFYTVSSIMKSKFIPVKALQKHVLVDKPYRRVAVVRGSTQVTSFTNNSLLGKLLPSVYRSDVTRNSYCEGDSSTINTGRRHLTSFWPNMWRTFRSYGIGGRAANNPSTKLLYLAWGFCGVAVQQQQSASAVLLPASDHYEENMVNILRRQWERNWTRDKYNFRVLHNYANKINLAYSRQIEALKEEFKSSISSLNSLQLGQFLAKGCDGVLCTATLPQTNGLTRDLAIKMMFNYNERDFDFAAEAQPLRLGIAHTNIIQQFCEFQDDNVFHTLPCATEEFPAACRMDLAPSSLDVFHAGATKTSYIIMEKHDMSLKSLLQDAANLRFTEVVHILLQILEGLLVLQQMRVAHRDIKLDNILVRVQQGQGDDGDRCNYSPYRITLADFGHCATDLLGEELRMPYTCASVSKGGNAALMAPEIYSAQPAPNGYLCYGKSDLWSVGTLVYDLLGLENAFTRRQPLQKPYKDSELPPVHGVPQWFDTLVRVGMLSCDPQHRLSVRKCANLLHFYLLQLKISGTRDAVLSQLWQRFLSRCIPSSEELASRTVNSELFHFGDIHKPFFARITSSELLWCVYWFQMHPYDHPTTAE